jgi:inorganic pyrophosphatase
LHAIRVNGISTCKQKETQPMHSILVFILFVFASNMVASAAPGENVAVSDTIASVVHTSDGLVQADPYTLRSQAHLVDGIDPLVGEDVIRVVVEIPTGSTQKWEVDKSDGDLKWELKNGTPRIVKYLGYPGNYGMVPRTLLAENNGGDGDPLDVLVLGPAVPRGSIIEVKIIGLLEMLDKGEQDDKLIGVMKGDALDSVDTIKQLDKKFPGASSIVDTWFSNYKGQKKIKTQGYSGRKHARRVLDQALADYKSAKQLAEKPQP